MSKDISTEYTKTKNKEEGRRGYGMWKHEKVTVISPKTMECFYRRNGGSKNET